MLSPLEHEIVKSTERLAGLVVEQRLSAHRKHGENSIEAIGSSDPRWLSILVEEVGEAAHELTYDATGSLRAELVDVITVATAWVAAIDRDSSPSAGDGQAVVTSDVPVARTVGGAAAGNSSRGP